MENIIIIVFPAAVGDNRVVSLSKGPLAGSLHQFIRRLKRRKLVEVFESYRPAVEYRMR